MIWSQGARSIIYCAINLSSWVIFHLDMDFSFKRNNFCLSFSSFSPSASLFNFINISTSIFSNPSFAPYLLAAPSSVSLSLFTSESEILTNQFKHTKQLNWYCRTRCFRLCHPDPPNCWQAHILFIYVYSNKYWAHTGKNNLFNSRFALEMGRIKWRIFFEVKKRAAWS